MNSNESKISWLRNKSCANQVLMTFLIYLTFYPNFWKIIDSLTQVLAIALYICFIKKFFMVLIIIFTFRLPSQIYSITISGNIRLF